jgi:thioredoxin:protein disulfide reductase
MIFRCARARGLGLLLGLLTAAFAIALMPAVAQAADDFLEPEKAFRFDARALDDRTVEVRFEIAPGYYMYRERFAFEAAAPAQLGAAQLPAGKVKYDETFAKDVETYRGELRIAVPVQTAQGALRLLVTSQGCADAGLCYPPMQSAAEVRLVAFGATANEVRIVPAEAAAVSTAGTVLGGAAQASTPAQSVPIAATAPVSDDSRLAALLHRGQWLPIVLGFFIAGLLLSLTPCVLPMLPILSAVIAGEGEAVTRMRGLMLALSYSLGMALVYTALGVAAGLAGEGLAAWFQKPWVLALFAGSLALLALSMFGFYDLQLPARWRDRVANGKSGAGRLGGVFAMGGLSAVMVSPCVAAPLAGALVFISQSRDAVLGGAALFTLAMGMSVPLLLLGLSAGHLLPRSGAWMEHIKHAFGVLLLAAALWILQPALPSWVAMLAWGALLLVSAVYLRVFEPLHPGPRIGWARLFKGIGLIFALVGAMQLVGVASGGRDPLQPLAHFAQAGIAQAGIAQAATTVPLPGTGVRFERVATLAQLQQRVQSAGRPVMLDFYADWCVSCKEMEKLTFSDERVRSRLAQALLLQADVTANSDADRELLKRFRLFGPPGIIFFDAQGREIDGLRVIGYQDADRFLASLQAAGI